MLLLAQKLFAQRRLGCAGIQPDAEKRPGELTVLDLTDQPTVVVVASAGLRKVEADDAVAVDDIGENLLHQRAPSRTLIRRAVAELGELIDAALGDHGTDEASVIDKLQRERL